MRDALAFLVFVLIVLVPCLLALRTGRNSKD